MQGLEEQNSFQMNLQVPAHKLDGVAEEPPVTFALLIGEASAVNLVQIKFRRIFGLRKEMSCVGLKLSAGFSGKQRIVDLSTCIAVVFCFEDDRTQGVCLQESSSD